MKKIKIFSVSTLIRGRKSGGAEDAPNYKNWRKVANNSSSDSIN